MLHIEPGRTSCGEVGECPGSADVRPTYRLQIGGRYCRRLSVIESALRDKTILRGYSTARSTRRHHGAYSSVAAAWLGCFVLRRMKAVPSFLCDYHKEFHPNVLYVICDIRFFTQTYTDLHSRSSSASVLHVSDVYSSTDAPVITRTWSQFNRIAFSRYLTLPHGENGGHTSSHDCITKAKPPLCRVPTQ
jgi:hypothetical protein